jgi:hypothetical protein
LWYLRRVEGGDVRAGPGVGGGHAGRGLGAGDPAHVLALQLARLAARLLARRPGLRALRVQVPSEIPRTPVTFAVLSGRPADVLT